MKAMHLRRPIEVRHGEHKIVDSVEVTHDDGSASCSWLSRSLDESLAMKTLINMHQGDPWRLRELGRHLSDVAFYSGIEFGQANPDDKGEEV